MKAGAVTTSSFITILSIYWFLIRPFNALRVIFGMKMIRKGSKKQTVEFPHETIPAFVNKNEFDNRQVTGFKKR
jgi:hypothetical protein